VRPPRPRRDDDGAASLVVVIGAAIAALVVMIPLLMSIGSSSLSAAAAACTPAGTTQPEPSAAANSIPANYLALFRQAGRQYGIPWTVLAGIGKVESDDGANDGPSSAGALGPMQFLPSTWQIYGDGGDIMNPAAAIPAAARLLLANGAPASIPAALFAYNHSPDYVTDVLAWARTYAAGDYTISGGQQAGCSLAAAAPAPSKIAAQIIGYPPWHRSASPTSGVCRRPRRLRLLTPHLRRVPQRRRPSCRAPPSACGHFSRTYPKAGNSPATSCSSISVPEPLPTIPGTSGSSSEPER
jgi:hypothetical protein